MRYLLNVYRAEFVYIGLRFYTACDRSGLMCCVMAVT